MSLKACLPPTSVASKQQLVTCWMSSVVATGIWTIAGWWAVAILQLSSLVIIRAGLAGMYDGLLRLCQARWLESAPRTRQALGLIRASGRLVLKPKSKTGLPRQSPLHPPCRVCVTFTFARL